MTIVNRMLGQAVNVRTPKGQKGIADWYGEAEDALKGARRQH